MCAGRRAQYWRANCRLSVGCTRGPRRALCCRSALDFRLSSYGAKGRARVAGPRAACSCRAAPGPEWRTSRAGPNWLAGAGPGRAKAGEPTRLAKSAACWRKFFKRKHWPKWRQRPRASTHHWPIERASPDRAGGRAGGRASSHANTNTNKNTAPAQPTINFAPEPARAASAPPPQARPTRPAYH